MLASIHPLGERVRGNRWWLTAAAYIIGSTAGGVLAGAALGALGSQMLRLGQGLAGPRIAATPARGWLLVGAAGFAALADLRWDRPPWPVRRQVDDAWLRRYRGWVYGGGFGVQLGLALVTIVSTASVLVAWLAALVAATPVAGAAVGLVFGLSRGVPLLATARVASPADLWRFQQRFQAAALPARWATVAALGAGAVVGGALLAAHP